MNHPKHIDPRLDPTRTIRAPRGSEKVCKTGWPKRPTG